MPARRTRQAADAEVKAEVARTVAHGVEEAEESLGEHISPCRWEVFGADLSWAATPVVGLDICPGTVCKVPSATTATV